MRLLFVDACVRGDESRTRMLAETFLETFQKANPAAQIETVDLPKRGLMPYNEEMLKERERLIDAGMFENALFDLAHQFANADCVLIAAPYWDFSFPSMLKVYVEHIYARLITFVYDDVGPVALGKATRAIFLTTAGSGIHGANFGGDYLRYALGILGIRQFDQISAENLDILGSDVYAIMKHAKDEARELAAQL